MNFKYLKRFFVILMIFIFAFNIDNIKADNGQIVAKITPTICDSKLQTWNYIPTGGTSSTAFYSAFFGNSFNGIYYCVSNAADGGGIGFTYFILNPNPAKKIFFPVIYWDKKNNPESYSENLRLTFTDAYLAGGDAETYAKEKDEIFENVKNANSNYAKTECEKYCTACHSTKDGYAYYCNDYELKKNYYTYSPLNFQGEAKAWSNFGWGLIKLATFQWKKLDDSLELFGTTMSECLKSEYDYCNGNIIYTDDETLSKNAYTLVSGKKCWNYIDEVGDRYWMCEVLADCNDSCLGKCVSPGNFHSQTKSNIGALKSDIKAYYCLGTKNRNTKFSNGDSTEDQKYFTSNYDTIKSMDKYDGDNIKASLGNIYRVGTGKITCEGVFGKDGKGQLGKILRDIFKYMRIAAIGLFIIFTALDFIKAIAGSDDRAIKDAIKNLTKRFMILLILLILPALINIVLSIIEIKNGLCFLN